MELQESEAVDNFKRAILDCSRGVAATVLNSCAGRAAKVSELDPAFGARLGLESSAEVLLLPVLLKERVAALLLAVSGSSDDMAGLEVLVQVAQLALDLQSYRKAAPQAASPKRRALLRQRAAQPAPAVPSCRQPMPAQQRMRAGRRLRGRRLRPSAVAEPPAGCPGCG